MRGWAVCHFTHLLWETARTCRSRREQFGHLTFQRRGTGNHALGRRGSGGHCGTARILECGQRAALLDHAEKQLWVSVNIITHIHRGAPVCTHTRTTFSAYTRAHTDRHTHTHTHAHMHVHTPTCMCTQA